MHQQKPDHLDWWCDTTPSFAPAAWHTAIPKTGRSTEFHIVFIGDSIVRELSMAFERIVRSRHVKVHYYEVMMLSVALKDPTCIWRVVLQEALSRLAAGDFDAAVVGGLGAHYLSRGVMQKWSNFTFPWRDDTAPINTHIERLLPVQEQLSCLADNLQLPITFVGTLPPDPEVMLLGPPKGDWTRYSDLTIAQSMVQAERSVERYFSKLSNRKKSRTTSSGLLNFLHPSELSDACPGVRCDGFHFGSAFDEFNCSASIYIWYPFLQNYIEKTLSPALLAAKRIRDSRPTTGKDRVLDTLASGSTSEGLSDTSPHARKVGSECGLEAALLRKPTQSELSKTTLRSDGPFAKFATVRMPGEPQVPVYYGNEPIDLPELGLGLSGFAEKSAATKPAARGHKAQKAGGRGDKRKGPVVPQAGNGIDEVT